MGASKWLGRWSKAGRRQAYLDALPEMLATEWRDFRVEPAAGEDLGEVHCRQCPKFASWPARCRVPMGSRIRSCICAAAEYNLQDVHDRDVLEIGVAERSFGKQIVETRGGRWTSVDPKPATRRGTESIRTHVGHAADLPFDDESFDVIFGIQTFEHWEDPVRGIPECDYERAMREVWRVLRPGGWIYFDAPIHLHGAPAFIRGDLDAVRAIFAQQPWKGLRLEAWRREHAPLAAHRPPQKEIVLWPRALPDLSAEESQRLASEPVWLLTLRAEK